MSVYQVHVSIFVLIPLGVISALVILVLPLVVPGVLVSVVASSASAMMRYVSTVDINECTSSPCDQSCINTIGSYQCGCRSGYTQNGNTCEGMMLNVHIHKTKGLIVLVKINSLV